MSFLGDSYFSLNLIRVGKKETKDNGDPRDDKLNIRVKLTLLNEFGKVGVQKMTKYWCPVGKGGLVGFDEFLPSFELTNPCRRLLRNDELHMHAEIWIEGEMKSVSGRKNSMTLPDISFRKKLQMERMCKEFEGFRLDSAFADALLITKTNTFKVHKVILAGKSHH
jgi:hypothetical protein